MRLYVEIFVFLKFSFCMLYILQIKLFISNNPLQIHSVPVMHIILINHHDITLIQCLHTKIRYPSQFSSSIFHFLPHFYFHSFNNTLLTTHMIPSTISKKWRNRPNRGISRISFSPRFIGFIEGLSTNPFTRFLLTEEEKECFLLVLLNLSSPLPSRTCFND